MVFWYFGFGAARGVLNPKPIHKGWRDSVTNYIRAPIGGVISTDKGIVTLLINLLTKSPDPLSMSKSPTLRP